MTSDKVGETRLASGTVEGFRLRTPSGQISLNTREVIWPLWFGVDLEADKKRNMG